jgi:serine/threonine protein kinase
MTESKGSGQPRSAPLPVGTLLSNYRIVKKLASGGFSFVYLATDEHGTPVAVKEYLPSSLARRAPGELIPIVPEESASAFRLGLKYFFEEGRSLAKISHPAIVRVLNFFRENGTVYMVMAYEQGKTLQEHILAARQQGKLKMLRERFIRQVFHDLMSGLREVHIHKLLHLDIKPGNIYLREDHSPILLDFGAARQTLTAEASRFQPMYTPGFAAPELYRKHNELGPWTDIYSIGATIYAWHAAPGSHAARKGRQARRRPGAPAQGLYEQPDRPGRLVPEAEAGRAPAKRLPPAEGVARREQCPDRDAGPDCRHARRPHAGRKRAADHAFHEPVAPPGQLTRSRGV